MRMMGDGAEGQRLVRRQVGWIGDLCSQKECRLLGRNRIAALWVPEEGAV